jgi:hypothetical protein
VSAVSRTRPIIRRSSKCSATGLDATHHTRIFQRGGGEEFLLDILFHRKRVMAISTPTLSISQSGIECWCVEEGHRPRLPRNRVAGRLDCAPVERTSTAIVQRGNDIVVDVQTLGEYPTTVDRICLSDLNQSTVVWEIATANGTRSNSEKRRESFFSIRRN